MRGFFEDGLRLGVLGSVYFTFRAYVTDDFPGNMMWILVFCFGGLVSYLFLDYAEKNKKSPD